VNKGSAELRAKSFSIFCSTFLKVEKVDIFCSTFFKSGKSGKSGKGIYYNIKQFKKNLR
jgi:hypothetical protein